MMASDGVNKFFLVYYSGGSMHFDGCKTLVDVVERATSMHASRAEGWATAVAEMEAAVAKVKQLCLHDERQDAALNVCAHVETELWAEHGERWIAEATAPKWRSDNGHDEFSSYRIDHAAAEERLGRYLEERDLADFYDEKIGDVRHTLDSHLADELWSRHTIRLEHLDED